MTNAQLYLAIGVPMALNLVLVGVLLAYLGSVKSDLKSEISNLRDEMRNGFAAVNLRFDDMRDLWRAELRA